MVGNYMFLKSFESKLVEMKVSSSIDERIDYIYDTLDDLLLDGEFCKCDYILNNIDITKLDAYDIAGMLTITFPWSDNLVFRKSFYDKSPGIISKTYPKSEVDDILRGLK